MRYLLRGVGEQKGPCVIRRSVIPRYPRFLFLSHHSQLRRRNRRRPQPLPCRCARCTRHSTQHSILTQMLLAHKPHPPPFMSPNISHRRHPSAPPAVVVQATKTPGLLFISKQPSRPSTPRNHPQQLPQSHQKQHRSPRPKQKQLIPHSQGRATQPPISESSDEPTKPPSQKSNLAVVSKLTVIPATSLPDKTIRGRQSKAPKDKGTTR